MAVPLSGPVKRFWSRRWCRRMTYLLASGAALTGLLAWVVQRPAVDRWVVGQLDQLLREETGLGLQAQWLEVHPFQGRVVLHNFSFGGDLLQAERLELLIDLRSLTGTPRLRAALLVSPRLRLDRERLGRLKLKQRPPRKDTPGLRLDRLDIQDGRAWVDEPAWGVTRGECTFQVSGKGWKADQQALQVRVPTLALGEGPGRAQGGLSFLAEVTRQRLDLDRGEAHLGGNRVTFQASYQVKPRILEAVADGRVDLTEVQRLAAPGRPPSSKGAVAFRAKVLGSLERLAWNAQFQGTGIQDKALPLHPGAVQLNAWGDATQARLDRLRWESKDGTLDASGNWTPKEGTTLEVAGQGSLGPVATLAKAPYLADLTGTFTGQAHLPSAPWEVPRVEHLTLQGGGQFLQDGQRVGGAELVLAHRRLQAKALDLTLPELEFHGTAEAALGKRGLESLQATGDILTDAREVASGLKGWDIVDLDMGGQVRAKADFHWEAGQGIRLEGDLDLLQPRWHGARADRATAKVTIEGGDLRVTDLQLSKDAGMAWGDLWLSWDPRRKGGEQIDMCYRFSRMPVKEGLKAGDQGDLPIKGTGSGWVRLHGPFNRILMEGSAVAENAEAYGFQIPAVSSDFSMDIATLHLKTTDVRAADSLDHLGHMTGAPSGPLALMGSMDMEIKRGTWQVRLKGDVDSQVVGLPGPHLSGKLDGRMDGPFTAPFGPIQMPEGAFTFTGGRLSQGERTLEGLEGTVAFADGALTAQAGLAGFPRRLLTLDALQLGPSRLEGALRVNLGPDSADTAQLSARLSDQFLKDAQVTFQAQGGWGKEGLRWRGQLDQLVGQFDGFQLAQVRPGRVDGDLQGVDLSVELEGRSVAPAPPAGANGPIPPDRAGADPAGTDRATQVTLSGWVPFASDGPLAVKLAGSADVANLKAILDHLVQPGQYSLLAEMHPGGTASMDLNLGGTLDEATLDGTLNVKDGRVLVRTYPQSIENVAFTAVFHGRDITIPESKPLTGTLAQGDLKAWGQVTWQVGGLSAYGLNATLDHFQFRDLPEGFELEGSLDASLNGSDENGGLLKGTIRAQHMLYHADISLTDLILASALGGTPGLSALDPSNPLSRIDLDLDLQLAEPWEFDTNLIKLQGRPVGAFRVRGNLTHPGLLGKMDFIPGGRLTNLIPAGDIVLERGTVDFKDPAFFNPNLDILGRVDVPPYLVTLKIAGTFDAIQAIPSSTPSLRQDEIFAILIDPDAASNVGSTPGFTTQAVMNTGLANTGTGLLSSLALANLQERLRKTLNLDRVSVAFRSGLGSPETSLILGKTYDIFGHRTPLVFTHRKTVDTTTISGQVEWRFGNLVLQLGVSQSTGGMHPSGEIRHTWSPR